MYLSLRLLLRKLHSDGISREAAALSFTTMLALVPAATVMLSVFALVPAFKPLRQALQHFAAVNFMPVFSEAVGDYISQFIDHAASATITGMLALFVIALMLMRSIDLALNRIFRGRPRRLRVTVAFYWSAATLGPLIAGMLLWLGNLTDQYALLYQQALWSQLWRQAARLLPAGMEFTALTLLFLLVPTVEVRLRHALIGALAACLSLEAVKAGFAIFVLHFANYQAIYGALAALPALMVWISITWYIVLAGAALTALLGERGRHQSAAAAGSGLRLKAANLKARGDFHRGLRL